MFKDMNEDQSIIQGTLNSNKNYFIIKLQDLSETFVHITKLQILINISISIKYYKLFQIEILRIT